MAHGVAEACANSERIALGQSRPLALVSTAGSGNTFEREAHQFAIARVANSGGAMQAADR